MDKRATLEEAEMQARRLAKDIIDKGIPKGWGFCLILNSHGSNGVGTYISNCQREGMIKMLKEIIPKIERGEEI